MAHISKNRRKAMAAVLAPLDEKLPPQERTEASIRLSELVTGIATHVICHTLVDYRELLNDERFSIAHAFLQRVTSTHMCNHKLTTEGLVYQYGGEAIDLHEIFKTMTLTRTVYEHLAMFYFIYEHPKTDQERDIVWQYWKANSRKNGGCFELTQSDGKYEISRLSYSQAWKYLFKDEEMSMLYHHLSMHCHPVYDGLLQYQNQSLTDQGDDAIPLYLSTCFTARLCRLFLKLLPDGDRLLSQSFTPQEVQVLNAFSL